MWCSTRKSACVFQTCNYQLLSQMIVWDPNMVGKTTRQQGSISFFLRLNFCTSSAMLFRHHSGINYIPINWFFAGFQPSTASSNKIIVDVVRDWEAAWMIASLSTIHQFDWNQYEHSYSNFQTCCHFSCHLIIPYQSPMNITLHRSGWVPTILIHYTSDPQYFCKIPLLMPKFGASNFPQPQKHTNPMKHFGWSNSGANLFSIRSIEVSCDAPGDDMWFPMTPKRGCGSNNDEGNRGSPIGKYIVTYYLEKKPILSLGWLRCNSISTKYKCFDIFGWSLCNSQCVLLWWPRFVQNLGLISGTHRQHLHVPRAKCPGLQR